MTAHQYGIDLTISILGADGEPRWTTDSPNGRWGPEWMRFRVEPGDQALEIRGGSASAPRGSYRLQIEVREEDPAWGSAESRRIDSAERSVTLAGRLYHQGGQELRPRALAHYQEALEGWRSLGRDPEAANTLFFLGVLQRGQGKARESLDSLNRALGEFQRLEDRQGEARAFLEMGKVLSRLEGSEEATRAYDRSLELWRFLEDLHGQARVLNFKGLLYMRSEPERATALFREVLSLARQLGDRRQEASALNNLGGVHDLSGQLGPALEYFKEALHIHEASGDRGQQAAAWNNIASLYRRTGRLQEALEGFLASLEVRRSLGDRRREAQVLNNLGLTWLALGETDEAKDALHEALAIHRDREDPKALASSLHNLALVHGESGAWDRAFELWTESLSLQRSLQDRHGEARALVDLGRAALGQRRLEEARESLESALTLLEEFDNPWREAKARWILGQVLTEAGDLEGAIRELRWSVETYRSLEDPVAEGNALLALARAEATQSSREEQILEQEQPAERAFRRAEEALTLLEALRSDVDAANMRISFFSRHAQAFELAVDLAMELEARRPGEGWAGKAFELSERARARSFLDLLEESGVGPAEGLDPLLRTRQRKLLAELNGKVDRRRRLIQEARPSAPARQLADEIRGLSRELQEVEQILRQQSYESSGQGKPSNSQAQGLQEIQALLDPETLLVEYALGDRRSFLWAITDEGLESYELPGRGFIEGLAREAYEQYRVLSPQRSREAESPAEQLSTILLGPVAGKLEGRRLAVVADGALHYVPFAALPHPEESSEPLLVRHPLLYLPSASASSTLRKLRGDRPRASRSLAVLADPVFGPPDPRIARNDPPGTLPEDPALTLAHVAPAFTGTRSGEIQLARLPWSRWEAEKISKEVGPESLVALGFEAAVETLETGNLDQYRWLHFATHGVVESEHPELSALVLSLYGADGARREGFLRLPQIYNLKLNAELVVLSGCRTALGKEVRGEGLIGLTRGFLAAGAQRSIASLWKVQDRSSAELMARLYQHLVAQEKASGKIRPAEALRQAQLHLRSQPEYRDPYFWAAFALYGDW